MCIIQPSVNHQPFGYFSLIHLFYSSRVCEYRNGQALMNHLENCPKPIVAAIMGSCLGGGLELALACHYRIAVDSAKTKLGCPEIKLGLLPGAGGTQRLLSICPGIDQSLQLVLTGSNLTAPRAKRMGVVHQVVDTLGPGVAPPTENTLVYLESIAVAQARLVPMFVLIHHIVHSLPSY